MLALLPALVSLVIAGCGGGAPRVNTQATEAHDRALTAAAATEAAYVPPTPTPFPTPLSSGVIITDVEGAAPGKMATVRARAVPGASCDIVYIHPSGKASGAKELMPKTADPQGNLLWRWQVSETTNPGQGLIIVRCGDASAQQPIEVPLL